MPKQKTHKGTKKRFRLTANGKVKHRSAGTSHLASRKSKKRRRDRKRDFRRLWITRLSAACRERDLRYSQLIAGLKAANIELDRKSLSEIAIADPAAFDAVIVEVKTALKL